MRCAGVLDVKQAAHLDRRQDALPQMLCSRSGRQGNKQQYSPVLLHLKPAEVTRPFRSVSQVLSTALWSGALLRHQRIQHELDSLICNGS